MKKKSVKEYQDAIEFINYMTLYLEAGHHIQEAFFMAANTLGRGHFRSHCLSVMQMHKLGLSFSQALSDGTHAYNCEIARDVFENLSISLKFGTKVSKTLLDLNAQLRLNLIARLESLAHEAPIKMIFPLVIFIFPVIFILIGTKSFVNFIQSLGA